MPTCQYCGKHESSLWNLAGFTCSDCRPSCPSCGTADRMASRKYVLLDGEPLKWCQGCGQLLPLDLVTAEPPVGEPPESYDDVAGLTVYALAYDDGEGVDAGRSAGPVEWDDVPTYSARELVEDHDADPDRLAERVRGY